MKKSKLYRLKLVVLVGILILISYLNGYSQNISNKGTDFWVGYGHHQFMATGANTQQMVLYFSTEQAAQITVTIDSSGPAFLPNNWWRRVYNVPANSVISTETYPATSYSTIAGQLGPMPKSVATYDSRLFDDPLPTGFNGEKLWRARGIHITSDVPIVAYAHIYGSVSSGASMLLPTESWGYSYTSINSEQVDAAGPASSWVYVIAKENNTVVEITPSQTSVLGKPAGVPFTLNMGKGQIFQLVAPSDNLGNGPEFTGTKIISLPGPDGKCHQVAVFSGSSRTRGESNPCGTNSGRDNDMQQCFPEHTWGKRYLTAPASKSSGGSLQPTNFQTHVYKVMLKDPNTIVRKNGIVLTGIINNKYYKFSSNTADYIEADKPIQMAQFFSNGSGCSSGDGDPEMIFLTPMEQAIKSVGFYRNNKEIIYSNYVTLVVPTNGTGLSSLKIDNSSVFSHTYSHPNFPNRTVVIKGWPASQAQVQVKCDSGFTGITYGLGSAESYGYSIGAYFKNLNAISNFHNMADTSNVLVSHNYGFVNSPMQIGAVIAYKPTKIIWKLSALASVVNPNSDITDNNPIYLDSTLIGAAWYYRYRINGNYNFNTPGTYYLPLQLTSNVAGISNCSADETVYIEIEVKPTPTISFTYSQTVACITDSVRFQAPITTLEGYNIIKYKWTFPNGDTSNLRNPSCFFNIGTYSVKLEIVTENGGYATTTQTVISASGGQPTSTYTVAPTTICLGQSVTATPTSSYSGTSGWYWDYGNGTTLVAATNAPQTINYATAGTFIIKHTLQGTGASFPCAADTIPKTVIVAVIPVITSVTPVSPTTCGGTDGSLLINGLTAGASYSVTYNKNSSPIAAVVLVANASGVITISNLSAATYTNIVVQIGTCPSTPYASVVLSDPAAPTAPTVSSNTPICQGSTLNLTGTITTSGSYTYNWSGPNGFSNNSTTTPSITNASTAASGVYSLTVTQNNCTSAAGTATVVVNANPVIGSTSFINPFICGTATGSINLNGLLSNTTYSVSYTLNSSVITNNITSNASGTISIQTLGFGTYSNITVALSNCISNAVGPITLTDPNPPATPVASVLITPICAGNSISLSATSSTSGVTFDWTGPNSFTATGATQTITNATTAATGIYSVVAKKNGCTSAAGTVSVTVNAIPTTPTVSSNSAICVGSTLNLLSSISSTGVVSYAWSGPNSFTSTAAMPSISNATLAAAGTYSLTISENGCTSASASTTVVVNVVPNISSTSFTNPTSCLSNTGTITLNGLAANTAYTVSYTLASVVQTATITSNLSGVLVINNLVAGVYSGINVTSNNCTSNNAGPITLVDPTPPAAPTISSNNSPVCSGNTITLTANSAVSGVTYNWITPTVNTPTGATINVANATASDAGIYSVTVTINSCTSAPKTATVVVKPTPAITTTSFTNPTTCATATGSITLNGLTATTTYTVNYTKNSAAQSANITSNATGDVVINNLTAGTYASFSVVLNGCTSNVVAGPITLSDPNPPATPVIITNPSATVCAGNNLTLTANSATPGSMIYNWTASNGFTQNNNNTVTLNNIAAANAGTYTVTATLNSCTSAPAQVTVVVNPTPAITSSFVNHPTNCNSTTGSIALNGLAVNTTYLASYTFNTAIQTVSITSNASGVATIPNLAAGSYTNVFVTLGTCPSNIVGPFALTDPTAPGVSIITNNSPLCEGATLNLAASSAATGVTFNWTSTNGFTATGATVAISNVTTLASGTYVVTAIKNNCPSTANAIVSIKPYPITDFSMSPSVCMPNGILVLTNKTTVPDGSLATYVWDFGDLSPTSTLTNPTHVYAVVKPYTITLSATAGNGCSKTISKQFNNFYSKPTAIISVDNDTLCLGPTSLFADSSKAPNSTVSNWVWDFADGSQVNYTQHPQHKFALPGKYDVKLVVENLQSCTSDTAHKLVVVYQQPIIDAGPSFIVPQGSTVVFNPTVNDSVNVDFLWMPTADFAKPDTLRPNLVVNNSKTYYLIAYGDWQCTAIDSITVTALKLFKIPNAFSPNGDGIHDKWEINELKDYSFAEIDVFDRNGRVVFHSKGYSNAWDGTINGKALPVGTYYYIIDLKNGYTKQAGYVTILR